MPLSFTHEPSVAERPIQYPASNPARWIFVVESGVVTIVNEDGSEATFDCGAGAIIPGVFLQLKTFTGRVRVGNGLAPQSNLQNLSFGDFTELEIGELDVTGRQRVWTGQGGGWRDMIGQIYVPQTDIGDPSWSNIGSSGYKAYKVSIGQEIQIFYHLQHDYAPGSSIFLHVHWLSDGVDTNPVAWEFTYDYAKGFDQGNYDLSENTIDVMQAPPGTPYRHMTTEIAVAISDDNFEPDGILMVRVQRVDNGATDNEDGIFILTADCHYQSDELATKNRTPNFYT